MAGFQWKNLMVPTYWWTTMTDFTQFKAINSKLKKRFLLRKPNFSEASQQFSDLSQDFKEFKVSFKALYQPESSANVYVFISVIRWLLFSGISAM